MAYATEHIAERLRTARKAIRLSQRDVSVRSGVPQSHISKIDSGTVDLRVLSLVELARVLNLEFALVPHKLLPAVEAILRRKLATLPAGGVAPWAHRCSCTPCAAS